MTATNSKPIVPMANGHKPQAEGMPNTSDESQTAQDFINSQLQLEADAREALPYQFDTCTRALGPIRQSLFSCLTCNPPPANASDPYTPAGVCYSCSISCHGKHTLVELFSKRNFVCDCGTTRIPSTSPCNLRINSETGLKGGVHSEAPAPENKYNHNFQNKFCGCGDDYNAHEEKGTMFQCLGLGTVEEGGCGEDWWHPECIMGLDRSWHKRRSLTTLDNQLGHVANHALDGQNRSNAVTNGEAENQQAAELNGSSLEGAEIAAEEDPPLPPGFPREDDFDAFICYKCADAVPWIKRYAGTPGFLPAVAHGGRSSAPINEAKSQSNGLTGNGSNGMEGPSSPRKRKAEDDEEAEPQLKRHKSHESSPSLNTKLDPTLSHRIQGISAQHPQPENATSETRCSTLPAAPPNSISLFMKPDFRDHLCHCPQCFPLLSQHPQLLEEEEAYEPPLSEDGDAANGTGSVGTGSLLDRGEAALSNVDRVRAIEGVMVYNNLRDKVKSFLQPFAESGQAVGAEDIKAYFEKLRGDAEAIKAAGARGGGDEDGGEEGDRRREQSGY